MSKSKSPNRKFVFSPTLTVTIIVAVLGCAGTVVTALITGYFAYLNTTTQIERPIAFTQTAESLPTVAPQPTQQEIAFDWKAIMSIEHNTFCPAVYTPEYLFAGIDKFTWVMDNLLGLYRDDQLMYAPNGLMLGIMDGDISLSLTITSSPNNQDWIILLNKLTVTIRNIGDVPGVSEIMQFGGCGAGGSYRNFSSVPLNIDYPEYNVISTTADADFFTLQPGELEVFVLVFHCSAPGLYAAEVNIPITFQSKDENVIYIDIPGFNCPSGLNYNYLDYDSTNEQLKIYNVEQYYWTGTAYQRLNP